MKKRTKNKSSERKDVFLPGGSDLEMYQIKKRLSQNKKSFIDKNLPWGAKVEDYKREIVNILEDGNIPVAIELRDADKAPGVVDIDHHGDKTGRPASLVQIMERIGMPLSFMDELVAANDFAYIPGLERKLEEFRPKLEKRYGEVKFGKFKQKMVDLIRRMDREKQGVTTEQELFAKEVLLKK